MTVLRQALAALDPTSGCGPGLLQLVQQRLDQLPLPGAGHTLQRWQALADVAAHDASLVKLFEGHTDALAILQALGAAHEGGRMAAPERALWAVWASEAPPGRVMLTDGAHPEEVQLNGIKHWCSGAASVDFALLTAWEAGANSPQLVALPLAQAGVRMVPDAWHAVGMAGSGSFDVQLTHATGWRVGTPGAYVSRPGFWHGGAGVAACWYGGAVALARMLQQSLVNAAAHPGGAAPSPFKLAATGRTEVALRSTAALLRDAARWIDQHPDRDACSVALRVRLAAQACVQQVLDDVGRALGPAPFCRNAAFARHAADLPVFIRQCPTDADFAALGQRVIEQADEKDTPWLL
jgi:hypothetical protein